MISPRIQHVSVPRPPGAASQQQARQFYRDVLGCDEVPVPSSLSHMDLVWFRWGPDEIHVYAADRQEALPHQGSHFCLAIQDLEGLRARLEAAGSPCEDADPIPDRPRFFTRDPFGNLIEVSGVPDGHVAR